MLKITPKFKTEQVIDIMESVIIKDAYREIELAGLETVNYIVENRMNGVNTGDKYSSKYGLKPIQVRTGNLKRSVDMIVKEKGKIIIGSFGVFYAKFLELAIKLQKYRWLRPAMDFFVDIINAKLKAKYG